MMQKRRNCTPERERKPEGVPRVRRVVKFGTSLSSPLCQKWQEKGIE